MSEYIPGQQLSPVQAAAIRKARKGQLAASEVRETTVYLDKNGTPYTRGADGSLTVISGGSGGASVTVLPAASAIGRDALSSAGANNTAVTAHLANSNNPHAVTKEQLLLGEADSPRFAHLDVTGSMDAESVWLTGGLTVQGGTAFSSDLNTTGGLNIDQTANVGGDANITGRTTIGGMATVGGMLGVTGMMDVQGDTHLEGGLTVKSDIAGVLKVGTNGYVTGAATATDIGADPTGTAASAVTAHEGTYDHAKILHTNRDVLDAIDQHLHTTASAQLAKLLLTGGDNNAQLILRKSATQPGAMIELRNESNVTTVYGNTGGWIAGSYVLSTSGLYYAGYTRNRIEAGPVAAGGAYPWMFRSGNGTNYTGGEHYFCTDGVDRWKIATDGMLTPLNGSRLQDAALSQTAGATYAQARGMNLIANGSGLLRNNYNFSAFTFDPTETHGGGGSFATEAVFKTFESDEFIPVNPDMYYRIGVWAKSGNRDGSKYDPNNRQYFGVKLYDADRLPIDPNMALKVQGSTDTTLAVDLNPGDTTVTLADATGWHNGSTYYMRQLCWYPYTNALGYTYPDYTYTRNCGRSLYSDFINNGMWVEGGITGNVITLRKPWTGPVLPAGTKVRNNQDGASYKYTVMAAKFIPNAWTYTEGTIGGQNDISDAAKFYYGTAYMRLMSINNYNTTLPNVVRWSDIWMSEISARNLEVATSIAPGIVSVAQQDFSGKKVFYDGANLRTRDASNNPLNVYDSGGLLTGYVQASGLASFGKCTLYNQRIYAKSVSAITDGKALVILDEINSAVQFATVNKTRVTLDASGTLRLAAYDTGAPGMVVTMPASPTAHPFTINDNSNVLKFQVTNAGAVAAGGSISTGGSFIGSSFQDDSSSAYSKIVHMGAEKGIRLNTDNADRLKISATAIESQNSTPFKGPHSANDGTAGVTNTTGGLAFKDGLYIGGEATGESSGTALPTGMVMPFAGATAPSGWLECNGQAISRVTYPALFTVIGTTYGVGDGSTTFSLPDLRGEFLRGWDHGRGIDTGRTLGSAQADELKSHTHAIDTNPRGDTTHKHIAGGQPDGHEGTITPSLNVTAIQATGGTETRPRNVALMYCIKA